MSIMSWEPGLDVGVPKINHEHQQILEVMNRLHDAHTAGQSGPAVNDLVARLGEICVHHFSEEEKYMASISYPTLARHQGFHKQLLDQFGQHAQTIKAAGGRANDEFFRFLKFWLTSHIKGIDMKYGPNAAQNAA
jgi:hemerythrin-like metal-binding protein